MFDLLSSVEWCIIAAKPSKATDNPPPFRAAFLNRESGILALTTILSFFLLGNGRTTEKRVFFKSKSLE